MHRQPNNYSVSSLSAGGKTAAGQILLATLSRETLKPDELPWQLVDLGEIARARARELGASIEEEAKGRPSEIDLAIEEETRKAFRRGKSVVLGRLPWMVAAEREFAGTVFSVWLECSLGERARRRAGQKNDPFDLTFSNLGSRDGSDGDRYGVLYGIQYPPTAPFDPFQLVVSSELFKAHEVAERIEFCGRCWQGGMSYVRAHPQSLCP